MPSSRICAGSISRTSTAITVRSPGVHRDALPLRLGARRRRAGGGDDHRQRDDGHRARPALPDRRPEGPALPDARLHLRRHRACGGQCRPGAVLRGCRSRDAGADAGHCRPGPGGGRGRGRRRGGGQPLRRADRRRRLGSVRSGARHPGGVRRRRRHAQPAPRGRAADLREPARHQGARDRGGWGDPHHRHRSGGPDHRHDGLRLLGEQPRLGGAGRQLPDFGIRRRGRTGGVRRARGAHPAIAGRIPRLCRGLRADRRAHAAGLRQGLADHDDHRPVRARHRRCGDGRLRRRRDPVAALVRDRLSGAPRLRDLPARRAGGGPPRRPRAPSGCHSSRRSRRRRSMRSAAAWSGLWRPAERRR